MYGFMRKQNVCSWTGVLLLFFCVWFAVWTGLAAVAGGVCCWAGELNYGEEREEEVCM
jgi:hypothetical protein